MKPWLSYLSVILLAGCVATTGDQNPQPAPTEKSTGATPTSAPKKPPSTQQVARKQVIKKPTQAQINQFKAVIKRVEPVAEQVCQQNTQNMNCDFLIRVDTRPNIPPNAYQSLDKSGRPVLTFTQSLIADVKNADELAFVTGHEAAHHIRRHLARKQGSAAAGAIAAGVLIGVLGGNGAAVDAATNLGGSVGSRTYSKQYELEADELGTVITKYAGYNPVRGAAYFSRIPDPGDQFLGSHPPNAQRIETVKRTAASL